MEVKPGYKQTEVGVIPEEWDVEPLGELVAVRTAAIATALQVAIFDANGVPCSSSQSNIVTDDRSTSTTSIDDHADVEQQSADVRRQARRRCYQSTEAAIGRVGVVPN